MISIEKLLTFNASSYRSWSKLAETMEELGFKHLGSGRHRCTFLSPNKRYVLKFPLNEDGMWVNRIEAKAYRRLFNSSEPNGACYAPCRLIGDSILMMRAVVEVFGRTNGCDSARDSGVKGTDAEADDAPHLPDWCWDIDSTQVGYLANGRLVAYDYGSSC